VLYWITSLAAALVDPGRRHLALYAPLVSSLALVLVLGSPIAYAAALVGFWPARWLLQRRTALAVAAVVALGAGIGLATTVAIGPSLRGEFFSIALTRWQGMGLGAASAAAFCWLARPVRQERRGTR
jgi:hypothetical protein